MAEPDPKHQAAHRALIVLNTAEILRRVQIRDYMDPDYVASEVLVTIVRARFGDRVGILDASASELYRRMTGMAGVWFSRHPAQQAILAITSDPEHDAAMDAWVALLQDPEPTSFAEVCLKDFLKKKLIDFVRTAFAQKRRADSLDAPVRGLDGEHLGAVGDALLDDAQEDQLALAIKGQDIELVTAALLELPQQERNAINLRVLLGQKWEKVARVLGCSLPTARQHVKRGLMKLQGVLK